MKNASAWCSNPKKVFVIGANGKTGFQLVKPLEENPSFQPKAMIRDSSQSQRFDDVKVPWIVGDLENGAPSPQDLEGLRCGNFCCWSGWWMAKNKKVTIDCLSAVKSMVTAQETKSVQRFILLLGRRQSLQASSDDLLGPLSAWHRLKAKSEEHAKESHSHGWHVDWTILCPGQLLDDESSKPGTSLMKASLIHGEDDLRNALTLKEKEAALKAFPGSHDGKEERLCISQDNTAAALLGLLSAPNTIRKSITAVDGVLPVDKALAMMS